MEPTTELQPIENSNGISFFSNKDAFEHVQRVARVFSESALVPKNYQKNVANCVIALEMANRMSVSPLMVMQNLDIIMGRPSWSSKFLIASLNACGKFSPLRYEEDEKDGGRTRAWAYDKATEEKIYGIWVSMEMAKSEGWLAKPGSKWKTMPELMRRYRAASFFTNQYAPEISMGFPTTEEAVDIPFEEVKTEAISHDMLKQAFEEKYDVLDANTITNVRRILDNKEVASYAKAYKAITEFKTAE